MMLVVAGSQSDVERLLGDLKRLGVPSPIMTPLSFQEVSDASDEDLEADVVGSVGAAPVGDAGAVHADRRGSNGDGQVHRAGVGADE